MSISETIKQAVLNRQAAGESVYAIAKGAGVPQPTLARFLSGERPNISIVTVDRLAAYLGLELRPVGDGGKAGTAGRAKRKASKRRGD